jgi:class 3 adenylate cyclase
VADPVSQQPGKHHPMHTLGEGNFAVASGGASRAESPGQTLPALPSGYASEVGKMPKDALPTGTITLLFTDTEGSTQLLQRLSDRYALVLTTCRNLLRAAFQQWNGHEVDIQGDSLFVAFACATDAVSAAAAAQRSLTTHSWPEGVAVRVRMGLHTGEPARSSGHHAELCVKTSSDQASTDAKAVPPLSRI